MSQVKKKFLENGAIAKLLNNVYMTARNAANSADVDILKVNASDVVEFATLPQASGTPSAANDLVNKSYADSISGTGATPQLDNLSNTAVNADVKPDTTLTRKLGSALKQWGASYLGSIKDGNDNLAISIGTNDRKIYDQGGATLSADFDARVLKNSSGTTVIDFSGARAQTGITPSASSDIANKDYVDSEISTVSSAVSGKVSKSGDTMSGALAMGNNKITGLAAPTANGDALRYDMLGVASGIATLDGGGKVPVSQLPSSLMSYEGTWNANTNSPTLADGTGNAGDVYIVSVAGSQDLGSGSISFAVGDWVIYNGSIWQKSVNSNAVVSVNSQTGVVVLTTDNVSEGSTNKYQKAWGKENLTLNGTDITNQYKDLAQVIIASSLDLVVAGIVQTEGVDYTVSLTGGAGGKTRISFAGDLATGGAAALVSVDVLRFKYQY